MARLRFIPLLASFALLTVLPATAASPTGSLAGHVVDEQGHALAGARIHVTGRGAVGVYRAATDAAGFYRIPGLPTLEPLEVSAEEEGRIPVTYSGLAVRANAVTRRDFRLRPHGWHDVLVLLDALIPYHGIALEGARSALRGGVSVLHLTGSRLRDGRALREALDGRPNAVLAIGSMAARLARREIRDVPVVYTMVLNPEGNDLTAANLCGIPLNGAFDDQLSVLAVLRPEARRLLTIFDPRRIGPSVRDLRQVAHGRGLELEARPARSIEDLSEVLGSLRDDDFDAFFLLLDPDLFGIEGFERVRSFTADTKTALIVPDPSLVEAGGTFSYGPGFREMGGYAGRLIEHLFSGAAEPSDLGRRFPTARTFTYNPTETQRLGITIPPELATAPRDEAVTPSGSSPR